MAFFYSGIAKLELIQEDNSGEQVGEIMSHEEHLEKMKIFILEKADSGEIYRLFEYILFEGLLSERMNRYYLCFY